MKLFTVKNLIRMFNAMIKDVPKFDKDYSLVRIVYDDGVSKDFKLLKIAKILKSDIYTNIEIQLVDVPAEEVKDHDHILRDQSMKKMQRMNDFVNKNTKEYEFKDGKIINARDGDNKLSKEEIKELIKDEQSV